MEPSLGSPANPQSPPGPPDLPRPREPFNPPLVLLDLNIIVCGVLAARKGVTSPTASCLKAARSGAFRLCLSGDMLARLRQVLQYPKLAFSEEEATAIVYEIAEWVLQGGKIVDTTRCIAPPRTETTAGTTAPREVTRTATATTLLCEDPEDDRVLRTALLADADYLVTGDADLLHRLTAAGAKAVRRTGLRVLTARAFAAAAAADM